MKSSPISLQDCVFWISVFTKLKDEDLFPKSILINIVHPSDAGRTLIPLQGIKKGKLPLRND